VTAWRLRVGRHVGRTIYVQQGDEPTDNDRLIGLMDTPELAALVVASVNNQQTAIAAGIAAADAGPQADQ
jgi:hypothetical protein